MSIAATGSLVQAGVQAGMYAHQQFTKDNMTAKAPTTPVTTASQAKASAGQNMVTDPGRYPSGQQPHIMPAGGWPTKNKRDSVSKKIGKTGLDIIGDRVLMDDIRRGTEGLLESTGVNARIRGRNNKRYMEAAFPNSSPQQWLGSSQRDPTSQISNEETAGERRDLAELKAETSILMAFAQTMEEVAKGTFKPELVARMINVFLTRFGVEPAKANEIALPEMSVSLLGLEQEARQFEERINLDELLGKGQLDVGEVQALADSVIAQAKKLETMYNTNPARIGKEINESVGHLIGDEYSNRGVTIGGIIAFLWMSRFGGKIQGPAIDRIRERAGGTWPWMKEIWKKMSKGKPKAKSFETKGPTPKGYRPKEQGGQSKPNNKPSSNMGFKERHRPGDGKYSPFQRKKRRETWDEKKFKQEYKGR